MRDEPEQPYASVLEPESAAAAELARGLLESEGIPVFLQSYQAVWYDGVLTVATGAWGRVLVPAHLAERAAEVLAAYTQSSEPASEDDPGASPD